MGRPKKQPADPEDAALFEAYAQTCGDPLPDDVELLQAIVCALLARIRRRDIHEANQLVVLIHALAAYNSHLEKHPKRPIGGTLVRDDWRRFYYPLLREMALRKTTRSSHCKETVLAQGTRLDQYLNDHRDFLEHRNIETRLKWITKHASAITERLIVYPCFCSYDDKIVEEKMTDTGLENVLVEPPWLKVFAKRHFTAATLRNAFLAMLHGITITEIGQIRKKPGLLVTKPDDVHILGDAEPVLSYGGLIGIPDHEFLWYGLTGQKPRAYY